MLLLRFAQYPHLLISWLFGLTVALTVHEFAHAKRAQIGGDPTPEAAGRVTLNPLAHYDIIGTTMILLFGFGWGKPVPVNPAAMRRPRYDNLMTSAWGAIANIITAALFGLTLRLTVMFDVAQPYWALFDAIVSLNLYLALFNMLPVWPLDGSHVLLMLLPLKAAQKVEMLYQRAGILLLVVVVASGATTYLVGIPAMLIYWVVTGGVYPLYYFFASAPGVG